MVRSLTFAFTVLSAAAIVSAQAPGGRPAGEPATAPATQQPSTPAGQQTTPSADRQTTSAAKVTYVGCVKPGTTPGTFILDSAEVSPTATAASPAGQPASAVGTSGNMKTTLNLTTKAGTDLTGHANHKMEFVGSLAPATSMGSSTTSSPSSASSASSASAHPTQTLTVDSFKMVSTSCQ